MSEAVDHKNAIRMLLRSFFPERDCITMVWSAAVCGAPNLSRTPHAERQTLTLFARLCRCAR